MNFLAHIYLSGDDDELMVGNFIADFVKGNRINNHLPGIKQGILLHREIDFFTDNHIVVKKSKDKLRLKYRHYAGVIVDMFYDHFLAKNWDNYHPVDLEKYTLDFYRRINNFSNQLPDRTSHMLSFMESDNWLLHYAEIEGIRQALNGMSRRTKFESKMEEATEDLKKNYLAFENEFTIFFKELKEFSANWIENKKP